MRSRPTKAGGRQAVGSHLMRPSPRAKRRRDEIPPYKSGGQVGCSGRLYKSRERRDEIPPYKNGGRVGCRVASYATVS